MSYMCFSLRICIYGLFMVWIVPWAWALWHNTKLRPIVILLDSICVKAEKLFGTVKFFCRQFFFWKIRSIEGSVSFSCVYSTLQCFSLFCSLCATSAKLSHKIFTSGSSSYHHLYKISPGIHAKYSSKIVPRLSINYKKSFKIAAHSFSW